MKYYLAPLEGITTYIFRRAISEFFGNGVDKYYTPFFSPLTKRRLSSRAVKDILPENNEGMYLVPQILTDSAQDFLKFEKDMRSYGYEELNINIGCPSGTVVSKGRGSAFLTRTDELDHFLEEVYEKTRCKVSVKTRLGMHDPEEFPKLVDIYNKYPIEELIIHARVGDEMYRGKPHTDSFEYAMKNCRMPLCYNGDVKADTDLAWLESCPGKSDDEETFHDSDRSVNRNCDKQTSKAAAVMCGRGMVANPALIRQRCGGKSAAKEEVYGFLERITNDYWDRDPDETHLLFKLKEIWSYLKDLYPEHEREYKIILKCDRLEEYRIAMKKILR